MKIIIWLVLAAFIFIFWARYIERHNLYFPMKEIFNTPEIISLPFEEVFLVTADGKNLHGWFVPGDKARYTVLFLHGNGGNISHRLEKIALLHNLNLNVFIFDYRGYGKSTGSPSEAGLYKDADSAYEYLVKKKNIPQDNIILYGESLGGAVAIDLALRKNIKALITEDAFSSVRDMARVVYPFIPSFIISNKFDSVSKIKNVPSRKLIIHSIDDEIVPFRLGEKLYNEAAHPKEFLKLRGAHNTAFLDSEKAFAEGIESFLKDLE